MRFLSILLILITAATLLSVLSFTKVDKLSVSSPVFSANSYIPSKYSCEGTEASPPLRITGFPVRAKSLALIVQDPDADKPGGMTHWVAWNLPMSGSIVENEKNLSQGINGAGTSGWKGMCPPTGTHHYHFKVYALDAAISLPASTDKTALEAAIKGHVVAEGELVGLYKKKG